MSVYKRPGSRIWWYGFQFKGERVQQSTRQTNKRVAEQIEAAHRTSLAKGEVGIREKAPIPRLRDFEKRFMDFVAVRCASKPRTVAFYREKLDRLLEFQPLANARLDDIDECLVERWVQWRRDTVAPGTVNRSLATLRRLLGLAHEWKLIDRVPRIKKLPGERTRDFVLSHEQEERYLSLAPQPLRDVALLILDTGLRVGEALSLTWADMRLEPGREGKFGYVQVRAGKSANARRTVSLTPRVSAMLRGRRSGATDQVFAGRGDSPFLGTSLNHQHQKVRAALKLPRDFVVHSLRHTALTRLGMAGVDAFTLMRIAGHSSITISQRYVHPTPESMERAFERLQTLNEAAVNGSGGSRAAGLHGPTTILTTAVGA